MRNFDVLGSMLASISASIWSQVGRLGASWGRLVAWLRTGLDVLVTRRGLKTGETRVGAIAPPPGAAALPPPPGGVSQAQWEGLGRDNLTRLEDPMGRRIIERAFIFHVAGLSAQGGAWENSWSALVVS